MNKTAKICKCRIKLNYSNICIVSLILLLFIYIYCLPEKLFTNPTSTVITDSDGNLLGAKIADDGQWRFPYNNQIPEKYKKAVMLFEDKYFYYHPGVNPGSIVRALIQNIKAGKIVSGGSTISMQVIRLSRKNKKRTIIEKGIEMILATRLECSYSKDEIFALYASNAPFGGNVVGLDAASWRYYGQRPEDLSWGEITTLAVLPNAPSLIHPGKNRELLLKKRNMLLDRLFQNKDIDSMIWHLSKFEPLPDKPLPLAQTTPHLLSRLYMENNGKRVISTIDKNLQERCTEILNRHHTILKSNNIYNACALIVEVETGNVLAYIGNANDPEKEKHSCDVDVINSHRSSGSILKPLLFACMIEEGKILPTTLIPDIPTNISGFTPKNFDMEYDGAVPAKKALSRSLNIPSVKMLQEYGVPKFHYMLNKFGLTTIQKAPDHYGLSLILGGGEVSLWELVGVYSSLSRILIHYYTNNGKYSSADLHMPVYYQKKKEKKKRKRKNLVEEPVYLSAAAIWQTYQALLEVNRPRQEAGWKTFASSRKIAWKTGTSFGFKDAWAIGTTPEYVVGVWVGNADGEGRPGLTGLTAAAPIMFEIFGFLPKTGWFESPVDELVKVPVCRNSGYRKGVNCDKVDSVWIYYAGLKTDPCPFHHIIYLSEDEQFRVNRECYSSTTMGKKKWFILPPLQEYYYKTKHPEYKEVPVFAKECGLQDEMKSMEFVYPKHTAKLYIPIEIDGKPGEIVFDVAHRKPHTTIFWHLDEQYIGTTNHFHQKSIIANKGIHTLSLVDEYGESIEKQFEVVNERINND